jgi:hypothetical protein
MIAEGYNYRTIAYIIGEPIKKPNAERRGKNALEEQTRAAREPRNV